MRTLRVKRRMETERRLFHAFLALHAHKAPATPEPCVHLQFHNANMPLAADAPLIRMTRADVLDCEELDADAELVRWLLHQLDTYDCTCQRLVCLVFSPRVVLSDVLRVAR